MLKASRSSKKKLIIVAFIVFFILYNFSFIGNEALSSGRLGVLLAFVLTLNKFSQMMSLLRSKVWILYLPIVYVLFQLLSVRDFGQFSRFMNLAFYSMLGSAAVALIGGSRQTILKAVIIAISVQSGIILFSFFNLPYRIWFDANILSSSNYDAQYLYRAPGLTSAGGSVLSVIQSMGVLAGCLLYEEYKKINQLSNSRAYILLIMMILALVSCFFTGRTGVLLSILFMAPILFSKEGIYRFSKIGACLLMGLSFFFSKIIDLLPRDFSLDYFVQWAFGMFSGNDNTLEALSSLPIPPLTAETFMGTGMSSLVNGVNPSGHDSGFIQTYYSMGLPISIMFYLIYLGILFHITKMFPRRYGIMIVVAFWGIEIKEPFLFKYASMFLLMLLYFLCKLETEGSKSPAGHTPSWRYRKL